MSRELWVSHFPLVYCKANKVHFIGKKCFFFLFLSSLNQFNCPKAEFTTFKWNFLFEKNNEIKLWNRKKKTKGWTLFLSLTYTHTHIHTHTHTRSVLSLYHPLCCLYASGLRFTKLYYHSFYIIEDFFNVKLPLDN